MHCTELTFTKRFLIWALLIEGIFDRKKRGETDLIYTESKRTTKVSGTLALKINIATLI